MRHLVKTLAATGLLLFGMNATAQYRPRDEFPSSDLERQDQFLDRLRGDLSFAETAATPLTGDRSRIDRAMEEVNSLQYRIDRGDYDSRQFDRTIRAVQEVIRQNTSLTDRNLDALTDDASRLRAVEARSADWR
jgi:hypothetical protein